MRVAICVSNFKNDLREAISKSATLLCACLDERLDATLLIPGEIAPEAAPGARVRSVSFARERTYLSRSRVLWNVIALGRHLRRHATSYDVIHFQVGTPLELFLLRLFLPRLRTGTIATVWQPHLEIAELRRWPSRFRGGIASVLHHVLFNTSLLTPLYRFGAGYFDRIVFASSYQRDQAHWALRERIVVIPNGVMAESRPRKVRAEGELPRILYVGHDTSVKGVDVLIDALSLLRSDTSFEATLALSDLRQPGVHQRLEDAGLGEYVEVKGGVDVYEEMLCHDLFVLPLKASVGTSYYPSTLLECFAARLPVVASDFAAIREVVRHGETGFLVEPGNPRTLADAIGGALRDLPALVSMGDRQSKIFEERYTIDRAAERYSALYQEVVIPSEGAALRSYYGDPATVATYNAIRFSGPGGRYVDATERRVLLDMLEGGEADATLLEVAAGRGRLALMLAADGKRVVAVDQSIEMLRELRRQAEAAGLCVPCVRADAFALPFRDDTFGDVYSLRFVWHYRAIGRLLAEMMRVCHGGVIFDVMNRLSLAALTAPLANLFLHRHLHTTLTSRWGVERMVVQEGYRIEARSVCFLFPFAVYRHFSRLASWLSKLDDWVLARWAAGTVLYYRLSKPPLER